MTQEKPPFTKEQVKKLRKEMKLWFRQSRNGPTINLTVPQNSMIIGRIDWTGNNCAFSTLVLMLSSSNAGLNSINQKTFAGYILTVIINAIQETGSCYPIFLEAFRLELTNLSKNPVWSNWSELVEFNELYNLCVEYKIIIAIKVVFVPSNDNGSNVKKALNGKCGSTLVEAYKLSLSIHDLRNGVLSADLSSKHRVRAVVLYKDDHFSTIIIVDGGFFVIDCKGNRVDNFKAESTLRQLTIEQFQKLYATNGAFYLFEEVPFVTERQAIPPPPPAPCAQGHWFPPPQAPCASGPWFPPPRPQGSSAQSSQAHQSQKPLSVNITIADVKHSKDKDLMTIWSVSIYHPTKGQISLSGRYSESMNQSNVTNYTFDSDYSEPKRLFKYESSGPCKKFIDELNRKLNE
jgi:hypothetical protein